MILYFMRHVAYMACKEEATEVIDCEFSIQIMQIQNAPGHSREFKWLENFNFSDRTKGFLCLSASISGFHLLCQIFQTKEHIHHESQVLIYGSQFSQSLRLSKQLSRSMRLHKGVFFFAPLIPSALFLPVPPPFRLLLTPLPLSS
jgi:hypothetical protein